MIFVIIALLLLGILFFRPEVARLQHAQEQALVTQAKELAALTRMGPEGPVWDGRLRSLAGIAGTRLTLIAADGRVIGDSSHDPAAMPNHGDRPEVRRALAGEVGVSRRFSQTLRTHLLYVAIPLRREGRVAGVVRVARPQREAELGLRRLRATFFEGATVAGLLALVFGIIIVNQVTKPLWALVTAARQLGGGDFSTRVRQFGQDELGILARTFNRMAGHLDRLVTNLSEEKGKVMTILATMADGVIVLDQHQRVILANRAAGEFLGLAPGKMEGHTAAELLLPPAAVELIATAIKSRSTAEGEFDVHLPMPRRLAAVLTPIRDSDLRLFGTLMVLRDQTALRHLERVRQDFVANVSHELRTPLTAVKAMAETMLQEDVTPERRQKFLAAINTECDRLNALVGDLQTLTKLDNRAAKPRTEVFSLKDLAVETATGLFPIGAGRRPELSLPDDLPLAKADPDQVRQILINLLDNAAKYSPPTARFGVRASHGQDWVTVTVWDEGPGIPPAERERVFERFYRLDKARSRALGGTGLGLSIVKHLVEGYGGRVWVEDGKGAEFRFTVPRA